MTTNEEILVQLTIAEKAIANAKALVVEGSQPEQSIPVRAGDNLMAMVVDNPEGSQFAIATDFVQDVATWKIPKPCKLISSGGRLIGAIQCPADVLFSGLFIDGTGGTIIVAGPRNMISDCTLTGHVNGQQRGIAVNVEGVRIIRTKIMNIFKDIDTQCISGWNGTRDLIVTDCELEASGENIMFGGADSVSEDMMPTGIVIQNCHMSKKLEWRESPKASCKNLLELKAARNVIVRGCDMEYSFVDGQVGFGIVLSVRNQNGKAPWSTIEDVLIEDCVVKDVAGGLSILGNDNLQSSGTMNNVQIKNTKFENINQTLYGTNGRSVQISRGGDNLTLTTCTFGGTNINGALYFDAPQFPLKNFVVDQCEFIEGKYGIFGGLSELGAPVLDKYAPGYTWNNVKVRKSNIRNIKWPEGTIFI